MESIQNPESPQRETDCELNLKKSRRSLARRSEGNEGDEGAENRGEGRASIEAQFCRGKATEKRRSGTSFPNLLPC
jgi:hypothetical protein